MVTRDPLMPLLVDGTQHASVHRSVVTRPSRRGAAYAFVMLAIASPSIAQTMPADALVLKKAEYELYYMPQYRVDAERAVALLDQAVAVAKAKYGTTYRGTPCTVNLYPTSNGKASTGSAAIETSMSGNGTSVSVTRCTVHLLTWSAPEWKTAGGSSWGDPKDVVYWDAMLVNEYITIFQDLTARVKPQGFSYYQAPSWFYQGLEAYDGYYHATEESLARARGLLRDGRLGVKNNKSYIICCKRSDGGEGLAVKSDYVDGFALVAFLASQFGEEVHARILRSPRLTFEEALLQEIGVSLDELFQAYALWVTQ